MLTGKQRAYLRSLANSLPAKYQVGKMGFEDDAFITQIREGLEKNELIKVTVLENSDLSPREVSDSLCEMLGCEGVQAIGRKFVLYKKRKKDPTIVLPK
ncbi:MAG: YhbY family RNA-binding protein [Clostridia bacterium]|nr:YhbY family RNA-binding protein [Clostridia bacterium]